MEREIGQRIVAVGAVLRLLYCAIVKEIELSQKAKLSIHRSILVPSLNYGHDGRVMTARMRSWIQATETVFLRRVAGVSLRD